MEFPDNALSPHNIRLNDGFSEGCGNIFQVLSHENRRLFHKLEQVLFSPLVTIDIFVVIDGSTNSLAKPLTSTSRIRFFKIRSSVSVRYDAMVNRILGS